MTNATIDAPEWKNMFGVCACIGEDFGFDPLWLRIAFSVGLIWNWQAVVAIYAALGVAVLVSRLVFPDRKRKPVAAPVVAIAPIEQDTAPLAKAA